MLRRIADQSDAGVMRAPALIAVHARVATVRLRIGGAAFGRRAEVVKNAIRLRKGALRDVTS